MSWLDTLEELRHGKADYKKAAGVMFALGFFVFLMAVAYELGRLGRYANHESPINPEYEDYLIYFQIFTSAMCIVSAYGLYLKTKWGKKICQALMIIIFLDIASFLFFCDKFKYDVVLTIVFAIVFGFCGIWLYFRFRYIGRLPSVENSIIPIQQNLSEKYGAIPKTAMFGIGQSKTEYSDSLLLFRVQLSFIFISFCFLGGLIGFTIVIQKIISNHLAEKLFIIMYLIFFGIPIIYNFTKSPFEKGRKKLTAFTGDGTMSLFNAKWPFCRMLVYEDGLEIRFFFHRFFIPYDKMDDIPEKPGFLSSGVLIKSDLPEVPSKIRFSGFRLKKVMATINQHRNLYLTKISTPAADNQKLT